MKIKSIATLCKNVERIHIIDITEDEEIRQWIGDGHAMYPIIGLPYIYKEAVHTMFELSEKQKNTFAFFKGAPLSSINFDDTDYSEKRVESESISIATGKRILKPVMTSKGVRFFDAKYLAPLTEIYSTMDLFERTTPDGQVYFAAKSGFLTYGIIMPYDIIDERFVETMELIAKQSRKELIRKESKNAKAAESLERLEVIDRETGEIT